MDTIPRQKAAQREKPSMLYFWFSKGEIERLLRKQEYQVLSSIGMVFLKKNKTRKFTGLLTTRGHGLHNWAFCKVFPGILADEGQIKGSWKPDQRMWADCWQYPSSWFLDLNLPWVGPIGGLLSSVLGTVLPDIFMNDLEIPKFSDSSLWMAWKNMKKKERKEKRSLGQIRSWAD